MLLAVNVMENGADSSLENVEPEPEDDLCEGSYHDGHSLSSHDDTAGEESPVKGQCSEGIVGRSLLPSTDQLILTSDEETRTSALDESLVEGGAALKDALESMSNSCHATQDLALSSDSSSSSSSFSDLNSSNTTNNEVPSSPQISEDVDRLNSNYSEQVNKHCTNECSDSPKAKSVQCSDLQRTNSVSIDDSISQDSFHSGFDHASNNSGKEENVLCQDGDDGTKSPLSNSKESHTQEDTISPEETNKAVKHCGYFKISSESNTCYCCHCSLTKGNVDIFYRLLVNPKRKCRKHLKVRQ